jgi:hypothetical protein
MTIRLSASPRFFGPWVVRGAFVLAIFGWGAGFYGPPIYLAEVIGRTGWALTVVSAAVTAHFLCGVVVLANLHRLYRRFGVAAITVAGAVLTALGVWGWAVAAQPWQLFVAALASGCGWVTMGAVAINTVVSAWYDRGRPLALARAYNGASIGGAVFVPLWVWLITRYGFTVAAGAVGSTMILVVIGLAYGVFNRTPAGMGQSPDGGAVMPRGVAPHNAAPLARRGSLWRDNAFRTLAIAMSLGLFAQVGMLAHLYTLLAPALGPRPASVLLGAGTACAILGRSVAARIAAGTANRRTVAACGYAVQALGSLAMLCGYPDRLGLLVAGVLLFGSGIGNATSLPPTIAQADFHARDVARVVALIVATAQAAYAFAPAAFGMLREFAQPGSGAAVFIAAMVVHLGAGAVLLAVRRPSHAAP